jgi:hypothetical protein
MSKETKRSNRYVGLAFGWQTSAGMTILTDLILPFEETSCGGVSKRSDVFFRAAFQPEVEKRLFCLGDTDNKRVLKSPLTEPVFNGP